MTDVAMVIVEEYDDGSVINMAGAFRTAAEGAGHKVSSIQTIYDKSCHCGGCCGSDGCGHCEDGGCGEEDCLCTFAPNVKAADVIVYAFPCNPDTRMKQLDRILGKTAGKCDKGGKRIMIMTCSPSFDESVFFRITDRFHDICDSMDWEYAGEVLVTGLPDACLGGDPLSRKMAAKLAAKL